MAMNFTELDETTREWMLRRFEAEESGGNPYRSEALSQVGLANWPDLMRQAITNADGNEVTLAAGLNDPVTGKLLKRTFGMAYLASGA